MRWLAVILVTLASTLPAFGQAGTTLVTAQVKDANGALYTSCQWSVVFVGQNTIPGAGPYAPDALLRGQQGHCDSNANLTVALADNINTITPQPSQWSFSICAAPGYLGGPFCKTNILVTVTGLAQDLTSLLTPLMPLLPTSGGGGGGTITGVTAGSGLSGGGVSGLISLSLLNTCVAGQTEVFNGTTWGCAANGTIQGVVAGNGLTGGGSSGSPTLGIITCADGQVIRSALGVWGCSTVSVTPGSPANSVQFNVGSAFTGDSTFTFNNTTHTLTAQNISLTGTLMMASPWLNQSTFPSSITCPNGFVVGQTCWGILVSGHLGEFFNGSSSGLEYARIGAALSSPTNPVCADASGNLTQAGCTGTTGIVVNPSASQNIAQPAGTQFSANNDGGTRRINADGSPYAWTSSGTGALAAATPATITITCPKYGVFASVDTTSFFKIAGTGTTEYVNLAGGTCAPGTTTGTVIFTPAFSHSAGWTIGSASTGIQEAIIDAETNGTGTVKANWRVVMTPTNPPNTTFLAINARVTVAGAMGDIDFANANIDCEAAESCIYLTNATFSMKVHDMRVASKTVFAGAAITNTDCGVSLANTATITSTLNPPLGSTVAIKLTDEAFYWGVHVVTATSGSSFQYADSTCNGGGIKASHATPGNVAQLHTFIRDSSNSSWFSYITLDTPAWATSNALNHLIVVENDQNFNFITGNPGNGVGLNCDANFCGSLIYNPGPFGGTFQTPAVGHITVGNQFSLQCHGNGIEWLGGNTLKVSDSIIQGYQQYAIQSGIYRGGFGETMVDNVYFEQGCTNPLYTQAGLVGAGPTGSNAGIQSLQGAVTITQAAAGAQPGPAGLIPVFATGGATQYNFYAVAKDTTASTVSIPLPFGTAAPANGSNFTIGWPRIANNQDTITYDILVVPGVGASVVAPLGTGNYSIFLGQAQCSGLVCTATTNLAAISAPSSYTTANLDTFGPSLVGWPGGLTLGTFGIAYLPDVTGPVVVESTSTPLVFANRCGGGSPGVWASCLAGFTPGNGSIAGGTLIQNTPNNGGAASGLKGRFNFMGSPSSSLGASDIITLVDVCPNCSIRDAYHRPAWDATDSAIGTDLAGAYGAIQLGIRTPIAWSTYIGSVFDNSSWKNRQTATLFTVATPLSVTGATATVKRLSCNNATSLVAGDFTLGSGWGTGSPTLTFPVTKATDCAGVISIAATSSGTTPNPTIQLTFHDGTWTNVPICTMDQSGPSTADIASYVLVSARSATSYTWFWGATPTVSKSYEFTFRCQGS